MSATIRARKGRKPKGRGVLTVVICLLVASGLLRLGSDASLAFATEPAGEPPALPEAAYCEPPADAEALLTALQEREARIERREGQMADRMQALQVAEAEVSEKLAALAAAEASLSATLALADSAAETDLSQLTAVYENMKPQDAAALFSQMAPEFAAGFMGRMRPDAAAAIMTNLDPTQAYSISVIIAGRNALVPTE